MSPRTEILFSHKLGKAVHSLEEASEPTTSGWMGLGLTIVLIWLIVDSIVRTVRTWQRHKQLSKIEDLAPSDSELYRFWATLLLNRQEKDKGPADTVK